MTSKEHLRALRAVAIDRNFSFPPGFRRAGFRRLQECYNGIGAAGMPKWSRRLLTEALRALEPAALVHDYEWSLQSKSFRKFLYSNWRLFGNSCRSRRALIGALAALLCTLCGYRAYRMGAEKC